MDTKRAADFWDKGRNSIFDFAVEIADGKHVEIIKLAAEKDRTPALFYGYAKAGRLYKDMENEYGSASTEIWRDHLEIAYWTALARRVEAKQVSFEDAKTTLVWLMDNRKEKNVTVEKFRAKLQAELGDANDELDWQKKNDWLEKNCIHFPALGISQKHVRKIQRAAKLLQGRILAASGTNSNSTRKD